MPSSLIRGTKPIGRRQRPSSARPAATTLCAFHYLVCSLSIWATQTMGGVKRVALPLQGEAHPARHRSLRWTTMPLATVQRIGWRRTCYSQALMQACRCPLQLPGALPLAADLILFTATANLSIVSLNLSLMLNPVGFYQVGSLLLAGAAPAVSMCPPTLSSSPADCKATHHSIRLPR